MVQCVVGRQELVSESEAVANSNLGFAVIRKYTLYCIIKTFAEMRRSFVLKSDLNVVFMGISEILWTSGWKLKGLK